MYPITLDCMEIYFYLGSNSITYHFFFLKVVKAKHHWQTEIHPQILLGGNSITHHISFRRGCKSQLALVNRNSSTNFAVYGGNSITNHILFPIGCESQAAPMNTNSFTNFNGRQLHHSALSRPNTKSLEYKVRRT